jgi:hypothetical protein
MDDVELNEKSDSKKTEKKEKEKEGETKKGEEARAVKARSLQSTLMFHYFSSLPKHAVFFFFSFVMKKLRSCCFLRDKRERTFGKSNELFRFRKGSNLDFEEKVRCRFLFLYIRPERQR